MEDAVAAASLPDEDKAIALRFVGTDGGVLSLPAPVVAVAAADWPEELPAASKADTV